MTLINDDPDFDLKFELDPVIDIVTSSPPTKAFFFDPLEQPGKELLKYTGLSPAVRKRIQKADADSAKSTSAEDRFYSTTGYGILDVATPPYNYDELASFFDTSPTNHAAVVTKATNTVGLGYDFTVTDKTIERIQGSDKPSVEKIGEKIQRVRRMAKEWLNGLNKAENIEHILMKAAIDYDVFGNCYLEIGRTITGEIGYLGHIPAKTVWVRNKKDGYVQIVGQFITFFRNFGEDTVSPITNDSRPNELIHIKKYSPKSSFYGVPDSVACATAIVGDALASNYNVKFFDNSATPRYIVTLSGGRLSKVSEDKLFKFLQTSLRNNPHRTLFVPLPLDINGNPVKFEMNRVDEALEDGAWEKYRERNKQDILTAHGVPVSRIGGDSQVGVAANLSSDRMFKEQVVTPTQTIFENAVNLIVAERTDIVKFDLNELALTDALAQSQIDERYLRNEVLVPNDVRNRLGMPLLTGGDKVIKQPAQVRAEQQAQADKSRARDQERVANNSDSTTTVAGRNAKGQGSKE